MPRTLQCLVVAAKSGRLYLEKCSPSACNVIFISGSSNARDFQALGRSSRNPVSAANIESAIDESHSRHVAGTARQSAEEDVRVGEGRRRVQELPAE